MDITEYRKLYYKENKKIMLENAKRRYRKHRSEILQAKKIEQPKRCNFTYLVTTPAGEKFAFKSIQDMADYFGFSKSWMEYKICKKTDVVILDHFITKERR